jgi:uncharacterized protein with HEPN domain
MDLTGFTEVLKTSNAAERCLERISEAAKKLGAAAEELVPLYHGPNCVIGNLLRHEYDRVDVARGWLTIEDDLAPLKGAVEEALKQLRKSEG